MTLLLPYTGLYAGLNGGRGNAGAFRDGMPYRTLFCSARIVTTRLVLCPCLFTLAPTAFLYHAPCCPVRNLRCTRLLPGSFPTVLLPFLWIVEQDLVAHWTLCCRAGDALFFAWLVGAVGWQAGLVPALPSNTKTKTVANDLPTTASCAVSFAVRVGISRLPASGLYGVTRVLL
jgi:hypothetical protein